MINNDSKLSEIYSNLEKTIKELNLIFTNINKHKKNNLINEFGYTKSAHIKFKNISIISSKKNTIECGHFFAAFEINDEVKFYIKILIYYNKSKNTFMFIPKILFLTKKEKANLILSKAYIKKCQNILHNTYDVSSELSDDPNIDIDGFKMLHLNRHKSLEDIKNIQQFICNYFIENIAHV